MRTLRRRAFNSTSFAAKAHARRSRLASKVERALFSCIVILTRELAGARDSITYTQKRPLHLQPNHLGTYTQTITTAELATKTLPQQPSHCLNGKPSASHIRRAICSLKKSLSIAPIKHQNKPYEALIQTLTYRYIRTTALGTQKSIKIFYNEQNFFSSQAANLNGAPDAHVRI